MSSNVWMYWQAPPGGRRPPYLDLCFETVSRHADGVTVTVVDENTVFDYAPQLDQDVWRRLSDISHRSDYARTHLVYEHGGLWLDYDCLVMKPLRQLLKALESDSVAGWGREIDNHFYVGLFAARKGAPFLSRWIQMQERVLTAHKNDPSLPWSSIGSDSARRAAQEFTYLNWPLNYVAPVQWWEWRRFTSRIESPGRTLASDPATVMLYNKVMKRYFGTMSRDELLVSPRLLSRLLRIALGESSLANEMDAWTRLDPVSRLRFRGPMPQIENLTRRALGEPDPFASA